MNNKALFLEEKRSEVINAIKPYCELFGITDYEYYFNYDTGAEVLKLNNTYIGCSGNSIMAIIDEIIGYIIIYRYCKNRSLGAFRKQTMNAIRYYWIDCPEWLGGDNNAK